MKKTSKEKVRKAFIDYKGKIENHPTPKMYQICQELLKEAGLAKDIFTGIWPDKKMAIDYLQFIINSEIEKLK